MPSQKTGSDIEFCFWQFTRTSVPPLDSEICEIQKIISEETKELSALDSQIEILQATLHKLFAQRGVFNSSPSLQTNTFSCSPTTPQTCRRDLSIMLYKEDKFTSNSWLTVTPIGNQWMTLESKEL